MVPASIVLYFAVLLCARESGGTADALDLGFVLRLVRRVSGTIALFDISVPEARYQVLEHEAEIVRMIFDAYTRDGLSINAIARLLNQRVL
jgi:hypothetical protein